MLRRQARLRREYLYRKSVESKHKQLQEKKDRLKRSLDEGIPIHGDLRREAIDLQDKLKWTDDGMDIELLLWILRQFSDSFSLVIFLQQVQMHRSQLPE